jgi:hypothetical protein
LWIGSINQGKEEKGSKYIKLEALESGQKREAEESENNT